MSQYGGFQLDELTDGIQFIFLVLSRRKNEIGLIGKIARQFKGRIFHENLMRKNGDFSSSRRFVE